MSPIKTFPIKQGWQYGTVGSELANYVLEMATAQRTRPRTVVGAPRRAAWQLKSALHYSAAQLSVL